MQKEKLMRDTFIDEIYKAIKGGNKDIYFFNADLGANALDRFRDDPQTKTRFVTTGISEQNAVNLCTGIALRGKIPYVYAMAPFLFARPLEQIKIASATNAPINIVGVGVGYSYEGDGPTHYATEDVACIRALPNVEIITPCDTNSVIQTAIMSYKTPGIRYIRLDRRYLPDIYNQNETSFIKDGIVEIDKGKDICIFATGVMVHTAKKVKQILSDKNINIGIVDVYRINPFNVKKFVEIANNYSQLITLEEHFRSGGLGELTAGILSIKNITKPLEILAIDGENQVVGGQYRIEGWVNRSDLHKLLELDAESVASKVELLKYK